MITEIFGRKGIQGETVSTLNGSMADYVLSKEKHDETESREHQHHKKRKNDACFQRDCPLFLSGHFPFSKSVCPVPDKRIRKQGTAVKLEKRHEPASLKHCRGFNTGVGFFRVEQKPLPPVPGRSLERGKL